MTEELFLPFTGRNQVLIETDVDPKAVLVGFHGYGEPPERTLRALAQIRPLPLARWAPRGPHHFYDRRGRVVASWMTRFDREAQIEQQVESARALFQAMTKRHGELPVFLLGFSQGVATAWRATVLSGQPVAHVFQLAGDMPPEVAAKLRGHRPRGVTMIIGRDDTVVDFATMVRDEDRLRDAGWEPELHEVDGGHDYLPAALELVACRISGLVDPLSPETNKAP
jgi:predicted esterase